MRLVLIILQKIGAIFILFPFILLYFVLSMCIPNIILYIYFYNCLSPTRVLAQWELGLCVFHCCFLSNQNNAQHTVSIQYLLSELILEYETYMPGGYRKEEGKWYGSFIRICLQIAFSFFSPPLFCIIKRSTHHKQKKVPLYECQSYSANSMLKGSISPNFSLNSLMCH